MDFENKHQELINISKDYMNEIEDYEHNFKHVEDVVKYTKELIENLDVKVNKEACIISAYWHDVGRIKKNEGHEKLSADMLKESMLKLGYNSILIDKCYKAIENHKWNMKPDSIEGLIVKDADKLAFIGEGRWDICLEKKQKLDSIIELLPKLRNEILYFEESRKIFDRDIIKLLSKIYEKYYKN